MKVEIEMIYYPKTIIRCRKCLNSFLDFKEVIGTPYFDNYPIKYGEVPIIKSINFICLDCYSKEYDGV